MKTRMVEERIGELLGPIDWEYDFRQHFASMGCNEERKDQVCAHALQLLRRVESEQEKGIQVYLSHSSVWKDVYSVGMYDGWPYWRPTPAMHVSGTLGAEWHFFYDLQDVRVRQ